MTVIRDHLDGETLVEEVHYPEEEPMTDREALAEALRSLNNGLTESLAFGDDVTITSEAALTIRTALAALPSRDPEPPSPYCPCGGRCHHDTHPCSMTCGSWGAEPAEPLGAALANWSAVLTTARLRSESPDSEPGAGT